MFITKLIKQRRRMSIAEKAMLAKMLEYQNISFEERVGMQAVWVESYGKGLTIAECIAKESFAIADKILRELEKENKNGIVHKTII